MLYYMNVIFPKYLQYLLHGDSLCFIVLDDGYLEASVRHNALCNCHSFERRYIRSKIYLVFIYV